MSYLNIRNCPRDKEVKTGGGNISPALLGAFRQLPPKAPS